MVLACDRARRLEEARRAQHHLTVDAVLLDDLELLGRKVVLALEDVIGRVDLADVVHDARVSEFFDDLLRQTEPCTDRFNVLAYAQQMRASGLVLDRRREEQMADALQAGAPQLLVRDALGLERSFQLLAALALASQHGREIFGVTRALSLQETHLAELRLVFQSDGLLAAVDLSEVARHANRLRVGLVRDADRLLQQLPEDLTRQGRVWGRHDDARRDLDHFDRHPLGPFLWHRGISCARGSRGWCR
jgi:hypothetical protein